MVIQPKHTTVAYRCPHCGAGVMSAVGAFTLTADMVKLKCDCKKSEMTLVRRPDGKVRMTVPCIVCAQPHHFTVSESIFFGKELFVLPCPYSDINLAVMGEINEVKGELARSELELLDLMEKSGVTNFDTYREDEQSLSDPQILDVVMFVINDLDAEGKIYCKCAPSDNERSYDVEILEDGVCVSCRKCGAKHVIPTDSRLSAHAFLNADSLHLE